MSTHFLKSYRHCLKWVHKLDRTSRVYMTSFQISVEPQGLQETWITPDQLYGAISRFSVFQLFCMF